MSHYIVVVMTTSTKEEATKILQRLLEERLIACANIVGPVSSLFWWKDKIDKATEFLVLMKSHRKLFNKLLKMVKENHSYEVPEILALPILGGLPSYLSWLEANLQPESDDDG